MSLNLTVDIDDSSGFCFGVIEAINKAEKELEKGVELYCLGDIVHNDEEISRLNKKGIKFIDKETLKRLKNKTVLFRAHGEPPESYKIAQNNNVQIVDASCPIIKNLQKRIKKSYYDNNEAIIIYGKKNHPEVVALNGQINNNAIIIEDIDDIDLKKIPAKATLYSQTTQPLDGFYKLVEFFKNNGINIKVEDSICRRVSNRKTQLQNFSKKYNKIIFVAGEKSSNGKILFNFCKKVKPETFFVSSFEKIDISWFDKNDSVGITGATSTPKWLMEGIKNYLEEQ